MMEGIRLESGLYDVMAAREQRASTQQELLRRFQTTLISFSMNIPGPVKDSPLIRRGFREGKRLLAAALAAARRPVLYSLSRVSAAGPEAFWAVEGDPAAVKRLCVEIEDAAPWRRLLDLDVLDRDGRQLRREGERPCLICGRPGRACASRRVHGTDELQAAVRRLLETHFREEDPRTAAALATQALLYEVCTAPKPGLVDPLDSGSHSDMDLFTFLRGIPALTPYWETCVRLGRDTAGSGPEEAFAALRAAGKEAERALFAATGGINTHRGAIFSLGLLCGAAGRLWTADEPCRDPAALAEAAAALCREAVERDRAAARRLGPVSDGERLFQSCGMGGARGEAASGFPSVLRTALPVLDAALERGRGENDAGVAALLHLVALGKDTNMAARGGPETAARVSEELRSWLEREPLPSAEAAAVWKERFRARRLSPGGCADLLAAAWFLRLWRDAEEGERTAPPESSGK